MKISLRSYCNKFNIIFSLLISSTVISCGGGGGGSSTPTPTTSPSPTITPTIAPPSGNGYMTVQVTATPNNSTCGYANAPCVSVTVCDPNSSSSCVTIDNILLDTGSTGLRIFQSLLGSISLPIETNGSNQIAECVTYGDGSANWGPVATANIQLASDAVAESIPMQIINALYPGASSCSGADDNATPVDFGLNGILGVGPLTSDAGVGAYYSCNGSSCASYTPTSQQYVANPIARLSDSTYNNGLTLEFPALDSTGNSGVVGYAIFGVGTNSNNAIRSGVNEYPSSPSGQFPISMVTQFNGSNLIGFLDTGSNGLFFNDDSITTCFGVFYCPSSNLSLSANNQSNGGLVSSSFSVANASTLFNSGNSAFSNLAGTLGSGFFDYGLPFFYGRTVYIGFTDESSSIGTGPYWAF